MFVGISAVIYGIKREKGRTRGILIVAGTLFAIVFLWLTTEFLLFPSIWGGNPLAYGYLIVTAIGGAIIYLASKTYNARKGVDISLAFKELPPE